MAYRKNLPSSSGRIAKARTRLTIASDRLACNPEEIQQMQKELEEVLSKYMSIDKHVFDIRLQIVYRTRRGVQDVKTIQIK